MKFWQAYARRFEALSLRERSLLAVAAIVGTLVLGDALWAAPGRAKQAQAEKALAQKRAELAQLSTQMAAIERQAKDAQAANAAAAESARSQLAALAARLTEYEKTLVPAARMNEFLRGLAPASGNVEVVGLKTLPPEPLVGKPAKSDEAKAEAGAGKAAETGLFKHGVEIQVAGSYLDLLAYLAAIEQAPFRVLWGRIEFRVDKHPRTEMKLVLYTLSLDRAWLVV